jgi:hypothetical protein
MLGYWPVFSGGDRVSSLRERSDQMIGRTAGVSGIPSRPRRLPPCAVLMPGLALGLALALALGLAGCGSLSDDAAGRAMVAPGRFAEFPCPNIDERIQAVRTRRIELEQLMARSSQSPGGEFVNALAYRGEYVQAGGELQELAKASAEKKCATESRWSSGRQVY